jgi:hypothetical protein
METQQGTKTLRGVMQEDLEAIEEIHRRDAANLWMVKLIWTKFGHRQTIRLSQISWNWCRTGKNCAFSAILHMSKAWSDMRYAKQMET